MFATTFWELPRCVAGTALRAEVGEMSFEANAWHRALNLKIRMLKSNLESGLLGFVMLDHHKSDRDKFLKLKLLCLGYYQPW